MHWIVLLLVIIVLLLGGWWIIAAAFAFLALLLGMLVGAVVWAFQHVWPVLVIGGGAFLFLAVIGAVLDASSQAAPKVRKKTGPVDRPLPPISKVSARRRAERQG